MVKRSTVADLRSLLQQQGLGSTGSRVALNKPEVVSSGFTFVDDIARGTVAGLKPLGYEVINLGSDEPIILMDSLRLVEKFIGKKADIVYREMHRADVTETWANITKAKELLDWAPQVSHEEGVLRTVEWYQENREWAKDLLTD